MCGFWNGRIVALGKQSSSRVYIQTFFIIFWIFSQLLCILNIRTFYINRNMQAIEIVENQMQTFMLMFRKGAWNILIKPLGLLGKLNSIY